MTLILISVVQLGTIDYATGLKLQQKLVTLHKEDKIGDVLLLLEHKPVITLGRNAKASNVVASPELLSRRGVELFECDRGGDVTFHGPGQIVGYPIFDLRNFARVGADAFVRPVESKTRSDSALRRTLGVVEFVRRLEDVLMRTCADFAIPTKRVPGLTGVWTAPEIISEHVGTAAPGCPVEQNSTENVEYAIGSGDNRDREGHRFSRAASAQDLEGRGFSRAENRPDDHGALAPEGREAKLAAIGVHVSRFITSHGFALNVNTDLSYFNLIVPCGITSKPVTSMQKELGHRLELEAVAESISRNVGVVFESQILWVETLDDLFGEIHGVGAPARESLDSL